jgi:hypothetical protein
MLSVSCPSKGGVVASVVSKKEHMTIPAFNLGYSLSDDTYLLVQFAASRIFPGAIVPVGEIERLSSRDFLPNARERILGMLDSFPQIEDIPGGELARIGQKGERALNRKVRFLSVALHGNTVEFAPFHLRGNGALGACEPHDRTSVRREEDNSAFVAALRLAFSRCRGA